LNYVWYDVVSMFVNDM